MADALRPVFCEHDAGVPCSSVGCPGPERWHRPLASVVDLAEERLLRGDLQAADRVNDATGRYLQAFAAARARGEPFAAALRAGEEATRGSR